MWIPLEEEPTWAAANLEKNPNVGVEEAKNNKEGLIKYDEGTFTPTISSGSNLDSTPTYSIAKYTKIGREVLCHMEVSADPTTASAWFASFLTSDLPYTLDDMLTGQTVDLLDVNAVGGVLRSSTNVFFGCNASSAAARTYVLNFSYTTSE
jgi:hypothetical protein